MFGIKDARDNEGRYIKIQGRGASIFLKDLNNDYIISSENAELSFVLYQKSIKDFNNPAKLISEKERSEVLLRFRQLLEKAGYKVFVSD